jgi:hypothetical protein
MWKMSKSIEQHRSMLKMFKTVFPHRVSWQVFVQHKQELFPQPA